MLCYAIKTVPAEFYVHAYDWVALSQQQGRTCDAISFG